MVDNSQVSFNEINLMAWTTEMEGQFIELVREKMIKFLWEYEDMSFNAISIARNSEGKTEKVAGRR